MVKLPFAPPPNSRTHIRFDTKSRGRQTLNIPSHPAFHYLQLDPYKGALWGGVGGVGLSLYQLTLSECIPSHFTI